MAGKIFFGILLVHIIILGGSINSVADELTFRCEVKNEYHLTDEGLLVKPEKYYYTKASFSVERSTGRVIGGAFNNQGDYQMKVVDGGSFKVFSFAEKRGVAESLAIRTRQEGKIKSFIGIDYLQTVVTGICDLG
ncbi:MAG: hypothetical protein ACC707_17640 [Thiohalomonadales bacterium]